MVDAAYVTCAGADQFRDRQAGAEADFKGLVGGLHAEQRDHPATALPVGRAVGHLPDLYLYDTTVNESPLGVTATTATCSAPDGR